VGKAQKNQSRRELIEKMQREQERSDRRRTILIVAGSVIVALAIVAYPAIKLIQDSRERNAAITDIGAKMDAASCDPIKDTPAEGTLDHVQDGTKIDYKTSPPSFGKHYQTWAPFERKFYTDSDRPAIGNLVHNLEHGYTLLWYDDTIAKDGDKVALIERIAKAKLPESSAGRLIAAPFKADEGAAWPAGKHVAFARWDGGDPKETDAEKRVKTQKGHLQYCGDVSGEALKQFMDKWPATDAPEPGAG
jgi:hypothetical protein